MKQKSNNSPSLETLAALSPKELADLCDTLEKNKLLESFFRKVAEDAASIAVVSYWEKWLKKGQQDLFENILKEKKQKNTPEKNVLPLGLEKIFSESDLSVIFSNIGAIQLTFGCSGGCPFCGFDSIPGPREHILFPQLEKMFQTFGKNLKNTQPFLYWASEPKDYVWQDKEVSKNYFDVHNLAISMARYDPVITSKKTDDPKWLNFLSKQEGRKNRISVFGLEKEKIDALKQKTNVILYGKNRPHDKGMGVSALKSAPPSYGGIGCFNGVLLTPRGVYNIIQFPHSVKFPQAQIIIPIKTTERRTPAIGDSLKETMRHSIVVYQDLWRLQKNKYEGHLLPYITIFTNGKYFDLAIDRDLKIKKVLPSVYPEIRKKMNLLNMNEASEFSFSTESSEETKESIEDIIRKRTAELGSVHTLYSFAIALDYLVKLKILQLESDFFTVIKNRESSSLSLESSPFFLPIAASKRGTSLGISYILINDLIDKNNHGWKENEKISTKEVYEKLGKDLLFTAKFVLAADCS